VSQPDFKSYDPMAIISQALSRVEPTLLASGGHHQFLNKI